MISRSLLWSGNFDLQLLDVTVESFAFAFLLDQTADREAGQVWQSKILQHALIENQPLPFPIISQQADTGSDRV